MFGFLIKKTGIDLADNLLAVLLMNAGFIVVFAAVYGLSLAAFAVLPALFPVNSFWITFGAMTVIITAGNVLYALYAGAVSGVAREMVDGNGVVPGDFFRKLGASWKSSLAFGLVQGVGVSLLVNAGTFYLPMAGDSFLFYLAFFAAFWLYLMWLAASHYFFPLQSRYGGKLSKNVRKMFILLTDNLGFTVLGLTPVWMLAFGISFITILLFPGLAALIILQNNALKLRVLKYDYLDAHPGADRRKIPWETLLAEERQRIGKRNVRSIFFPWKR